MPCDRNPNPRGLFLAGEHLSGQAMPLQAKAFISGQRHLVYQHCLDADMVERSGPEQVHDLHFRAHCFDPIPPFEIESSPWNVIRVHSLLSEGDQEILHPGEPMRVWRGPPSASHSPRSPPEARDASSACLGRPPARGSHRSHRVSVAGLTVPGWRQR